MKKYIRKDEVLVVKWTGEESVIKDIGEHLKSFSNYNFKLKCSNDNDVLCLSHNDGYGTSTNYCRIGEYVVIDLLRESKFFSCNEEILNKYYVEL